MSESAILYFSSLFIFTFFILGIMIGWFVREYNTESTDNVMDSLHPEFFDKKGNFIDDELLAVHFIEEIDDDDDDLDYDYNGV